MNLKSGLRQLILMVLPGYNHGLRMFEVAMSYPNAFPIICSQASIHFQSFLVFPWRSTAHFPMEGANTFFNMQRPGGFDRLWLLKLEIKL